MGLWEAIWKSSILGVVQGLTEFLPVSSSGHLTLLQRVLGFDMGDGTMTLINIMMHLGTLIAVIVVFWRDILALFRKPFKTLLMLIVATIPAGVIGLIFSDQIDSLFSGGDGILYLSVCFALTALLLVICEMIAKRQKTQRPLGWGSSVAMGVMQAVALFPGISRSGSTIVAGTLAGTRREEVAKFSFLMSIPVILGSFAVEIFGIVREPESVALRNERHRRHDRWHRARHGVWVSCHQAYAQGHPKGKLCLVQRLSGRLVRRLFFALRRRSHCIKFSKDVRAGRLFFMYKSCVFAHDNSIGGES